MKFYLHKSRHEKNFLYIFHPSLFFKGVFDAFCVCKIGEFTVTMESQTNGLTKSDETNITNGSAHDQLKQCHTLVFYVNGKEVRLFAKVYNFMNINNN